MSVPTVGNRVFEDGVYIGRVERVFECTWGVRKGCVQSIQVGGCDIVRRRFTVPGVLFWSMAEGCWKNNFALTRTYCVERGTL
jgi:hypothetical protein